MRLTSIAAVAIFIPSLATAGPITLGVALGVDQSEVDADNGYDAADTLGLFGRLQFSPQVYGELAVSRIETEDQEEKRKVTVLLGVDLRRTGPLVPTLMAGLGLDEAVDQYDFTTKGHHIEGGIGLEYRAPSGVTIGVDLRIGARSLDKEDGIAAPTAVEGDVARVAPTHLQSGEYRTGRIFAGVRF